MTDKSHSTARNLLPRQSYSPLTQSYLPLMAIVSTFHGNHISLLLLILVSYGKQWAFTAYNCLSQNIFVPHDTNRLYSLATAHICLLSKHSTTTAYNRLPWHIFVSHNTNRLSRHRLNGTYSPPTTNIQLLPPKLVLLGRYLPFMACLHHQMTQK